jgi:thioredoxin-related protein
MMKKSLFKIAPLLLLFMAVATELSAQGSLNRAQTLTTKGFIDKKTTFDPTALDSLLKHDDFVMLISSFEGCIPCEWLRTSDVFERYPISPYYTDFRLNSANETVPYTFFISTFPITIFFDKSGEIIAVLVGTKDYYEKLDRIVAGERFSEHKIPGVPEDRMLSFMSFMHKANVANMRGETEKMYKYATEAMNICPSFYNSYLLYKYYLSKGDSTSADKYKALALENTEGRFEFVYKKLIQELRGEN